MNQRDYLKNDSIIELYSDEGQERNKRQFHITRLISNEGGSTIAYRAYHQNSSNIGVLREFYPLSDEIVLDRNENGKLCVEMSDVSESGRIEFLENKSRYLTPFLTLKTIQKEKENDSLATFIPYFEICYGCKDKDNDDGTIYIWTPAPQTETFETVCKRIHENPAEDAEYNLYIILEAIYSLAQCTFELHNNHLIHRDIKPANFGFALRNGEVLTQAISFFDVDSICEAYPKPKDSMGTQGFMPDNKDILNTGWQDIYAIGATLFYAVIHTSETEKNNFIYNSEYYDRISELVRESTIINASENNSYPRIRKLLSQILRRCLMCSKTDAKGVSLHGDSRYLGCGDLIKDLEALRRYVIPEEMSHRLATGERWLLSDAKKWFKSADEQRSKQAIQYHLYKWPLYRNISHNKKLRVLILGMGRYGYQFLDMALQLSQNLDLPTEFTVVSNALLEDDKTDREIYISDRPELSSFFSINGEEINDPYGFIWFFSRRLDMDGLRELIKEFAEGGDVFSYIFIDLNNTKLNREGAEMMYKLGGNMTIAYTNESGREESCLDKSIISINVNEDIRHLESFADIERMSFNAHLVWDDNPDIDYYTKLSEYKQNYNYESSISNTLSIKYKLWNVDLDITSMSPEDTAEMFYIKVNSNKKMVRRLAWLEHKRWVTEKLCNGWSKRIVEKCEGLPQDINNKEHVCIVRSTDSQELKGVKKTRWDDGGIDSSQLDELDRVSVELHRLYVHQAQNMEIGEFDEVYRVLKGSHAASYFREWHESLKTAIRDGNRESAEYCKGCITKLLNALQRTDLTSAQKKWVIDLVSTSMEPLVRKYEYIDYKKYDIDLIEKIPYILTYSSHCALIVPMDPAKADEIKRTKNNRINALDVQISIDRVFSYVAASTIINPEKVIFIYKPENDGFETIAESAKMFDSIVNRVIRYMMRKNLRSEVYFGIFCENTETYDEYCLYKKDYHDITGKNYTYDVRMIRDVKNTYIDVDDYVEKTVADCDLVAIQKTGIITNGWLNKSEMLAKYSSYSFDVQTMKFEENKSCRWLSYVGNNSCLRVLDMASLVNRRYDIDKRMDFSDEQTDFLWSFYKQDSMKWKYLCKLLGSGEMQKDEIMRIRRTTAQGGNKTKREYYFPTSCLGGIDMIIGQMKKDGLLGEDSSTISITEDMCLLTAYCNDQLAYAIGKMLSRPERLTDSDCIKIEKNNRVYFAVDFSLLTITADVQGRMVDVLDVVNKQISNNIKDDKEKRKAVEGILKGDEAWLKKLRNMGYLHYLNISDKGIGFTYGSYTIKKVLVDEGKLLEVRVSNELQHIGSMNSIINGISFYHEDGITEEDELDCIATKGFRSIIIECKAKENVSYNELSGFVDKLSSRIERFAVNGSGVLLIDSSNPLPDYEAPPNIIIKRVDDIPGNKKYKIGLFINSIMN